MDRCTRLAACLRTTQPDEIIYVGRLHREGPSPEWRACIAHRVASPAVAFCSASSKRTESPAGLGADLKQLADANKIPFETDLLLGPDPGEYLHAPSLPDKWAHLAIATSWPETPAETIDSSDLANLLRLLGSIRRGTTTLEDFSGECLRRRSRQG